MDTRYVKRNPSQLNKAKHISNMFLLLNTATIVLFYTVFYIHAYAIYGRKRHFILSFPIEGALCIKYIKFSTPRVISRAFEATK